MKEQKEKTLLNFLQKECNYTSYKIVEKSDMLSCFGKTKIDEDSLGQIISSLEKQGYIKNKYEDENVYCICLNKKETEEKREKKTSLFLIYFLIILSSFLGGFSGAIISRII